TPLFTVLVAAIFLSDEKPSTLKILGVVAGFIGVVIMIGADLFGSDMLGTTLVAIFAQLACLAAALSYAFAGAFGRRFGRYGVHPILTATGQLTASSLILWPLALLYDGADAGLGALDLAPLLSMLGLAIASTALAYVIYFKLLASVGSTNLLLVTFLVPVTASLLGIFILGEHLAFSDVVGMAFIAVGLSAIDGRLWRR
ncbi:MAG: DMT family transporter, partial [Hyphomicrobiales bacterium]